MSGLLIETKKKIGSMKNTKKITKAMELVAASKMKFFQKKAIHTRLYAWDLIEILKENGFKLAENAFMESRSEGKTLFVLFTSDKGLCGALNTRMIKTLMNSKEWTETPADQRMLMTIGRKSYEFARYNKIPVEKSFSGLKEAMTPYEALSVITEILKPFQNKTVKQVYMVAPHYKNAFTYYPIVKSFLPLSMKGLTDHIGKEKEMAGLKTEFSGKMKDYMLYEKNRAKVMAFIIEELVNTLFIQAFMELKATEYSSRMIAMKNATDSSQKIIDRLTLELNKARQQMITLELADLVNSAEAIQGSN